MRNSPNDLRNFDRMKGSGTIEMLENAKDVVEKMEKSKRGDRNHHPRVESDTQVNIGNFLDV